MYSRLGRVIGFAARRDDWIRGSAVMIKE